MSIVNFAVPKTLEKRIDKTIKEKGFASKAEFFRFAALRLIDVIEQPLPSEAARFTSLTKMLREEIVKQYNGKRLPSLKKQLADV